MIEVKMFSGRRRVSPSMVVAFVALMVALGGSSYAVVRLPARSVGTKQLKNKAVTAAKIKSNAVNGSKVANDSLTGEDISEASLSQVPSALNATRALTADRAGSSGSAAALDKVAYRSATVAVPPAPDTNTPSLAGATASCDGGQHVAGGGVKVEDPDSSAVVDSYPDAGGTAWSARVDNGDPASAHSFTVYAICIASVTVG